MKNRETRKYPLNLQMFAEPEPEPEFNPEPAPEKTFTQEELDRVVAERIARERKKAEKFADYDDLKTKLATLEQAETERQTAEMTATERLEAEKAEAVKKAQESEERGNARISAANQRLVKAEFRAIARELNVRADALDDALALANLTTIDVDDEGNVSGVKDVVEALLTNKPYLIEPAKTQPRTIGDTKPNPGDEERRTLEQQLEEAKKAKNFSKVIELSNKLNPRK